MPVNESMMANMRKQYGAKKGKDVYYALENKMKSKAKRSKGASKVALKHKVRKMFNS